MKHLIYIGGFDLPDKNAAAQRVIANAKIFEALGYKVTLIGLDKKNGEFSYEGFTCINLKYPESINEWASYLFCIDVYKPFIKALNPEIIVAYNHPACALKRLASFCKSNEIKIISDCTEWYMPEGNRFFKLVKGWDTRRRMEKVHPKLDGIISISRYLHDYYRYKGVKSILLPPLVDLDNPKWDNCPVETNNKILRLVYAGSPGHKDRLDIIVRAISKKRTRDVSLTIIGIDESQFRLLYKYEGQVPQYVDFKGRLFHQEVLNELMNADFQIFLREDNLTTRAGFPTKFVESISAGIPVLTNLTSNLGDYISDGNNGFILDPSSDESMLASLDKVISLSDEEIQRVKHSIDRKIFDYHRFISPMKSFIESLY